MVGPILRGSLARDMDIVVIVQNTDRNLGQDRVAGHIAAASAGEGNDGGVGLGVNVVRGGEALRQLHMIQFPVVDHV